MTFSTYREVLEPTPAEQARAVEQFRVARLRESMEESQGFRGRIRRLFNRVK